MAEILKNHFNTIEYLGYLGKMLFAGLTVQGYFVINGAFLILFVSLYLNYRAFYEMFRHKLLKIDQTDRKTIDKESFGDLIRFHNMAKE